MTTFSGDVRFSTRSCCRFDREGTRRQTFDYSFLVVWRSLFSRKSDLFDRRNVRRASKFKEGSQTTWKWFVDFLENLNSGRCFSCWELSKREVRSACNVSIETEKRQTRERSRARTLSVCFPVSFISFLKAKIVEFYRRLIEIEFYLNIFRLPS